MSQFWHANWVEDGYKPTRLQNWEVPRWHAQCPTRHCTTTKLEAHKNGRLFASVSRVGSPWGNFKGTWELPLKITRQTAEELSRSTEYKKGFWRAHKAKHEKICYGKCVVRKKVKGSKNDSATKAEEVNETNEKLDETSAISNEFEEVCEFKPGCVL